MGADAVAYREACKRVGHDLGSLETRDQGAPLSLTQRNLEVCTPHTSMNNLKFNVSRLW